ncbi:MAG: glycosyltransferase [Simkaniaceae bacterium]|nr:glycosyltransferase [Candidatus Sacchlamyda saccharinae]
MGYINMADGLGRQGPELIQAFKKELKTNFKLTRKIKKVTPPKKIKKFICDDNKRWGKVLIFEDILWGPWDGSAIHKLKGCPKDTIKIAYSMYEATKIPEEWVDILNRKFDAVVVPSSFLIEVYQNSGVQIPIFEIPLGLDLNHFLRAPLKKEAGEKFVFGNLSAGSDRKNHVMLIRAFVKAFGDDPDVELRINARYCEKEVRNEITKVITLLNCENIKFTQMPLKKLDYLNTFKEIDCYVSPSKGEGFSIQPREAMSLGVPVIATNNTGQIPVCESGLVKVVESTTLKPALNPWGDYYGFNYDCHIDELAAALKEVKDEYSQYLEKGSQARQWASQYQYKNLKDLYRSLLSPKAVHLGKENVVAENSITTNSKPLFEKYKKAFGKNVTFSTNESVFTNIYESAEWGKNEKGKGFSGLGSTLENAKPYINCLEKFIAENQIHSIVDLGCGDWTFSKHVNWNGLDYTGVDVVKFLINENQKKYSNNHIHFVHADGADFELPEGDLLICKDVLQHLSNEDVLKITKQFHKFKHCLITNDTNQTNPFKMNENIDSGGLRPLDLTKPPFNLFGQKILEYNAHGNTKVVLHIN